MEKIKLLKSVGRTPPYARSSQKHLHSTSLTRQAKSIRLSQLPQTPVLPENQLQKSFSAYLSTQKSSVVTSAFHLRRESWRIQTRSTAFSPFRQAIILSDIMESNSVSTTVASFRAAKQKSLRKIL